MDLLKSVHWFFCTDFGAGGTTVLWRPYSMDLTVRTTTKE
jgi:hypothetical protein